MVAATVAVMFAVFLASIAAYVVARNALLQAVDGTLQSTANSILSEHQIAGPNANGVGFQLVNAHGDVLTTYGDLPITPQVRAVAGGHSGPYFTDVEADGVRQRELVVSAKYLIQTVSGPELVPVALQVSLPLTGVDDQLRNLGEVLVVVAVLGVLVAVGLGWLVARTALVPLDDLTQSVESVATTTDVSLRLDPGGPDELGRLRRAFNRLLAALERSRDAQRQLVLDAGHELRTPLTSLRTNLEVVRRFDELNPEDREVLVSDVLTQLEELTQLVSGLSELARGEYAEQAPSVFRLDQLVEDMAALAVTHGRARAIHVAVTSRPTWVRGRRDRITRAVGNLMDNALKWSPEGGTVDITCADGEVVVRDHGPGIPPQDMAHIFDRFYRSADARALPGSGLGLAIVAQVAETEGGSVTADRAEGGGALMRFRVPVAGPPPLVPAEDEET